MSSENTNDILSALDDIKGKTQDAVKAKAEEQGKINESIVESVKTIHAMAKSTGKTVSELSEKTDEHSNILKEVRDDLTKKYERELELTKSIDALNTSFTELSAQGNFAGVVNNGEQPDENLTKSAIDFYSRKHFFEHGTEKSSPKFKASSVDEDKVKAYAHVKTAVQKMFMSDSATNEMIPFTPEERKAISTLQHDNQYFMPTEISSQVLRCFTDETTITSLFDNVRMSGHRVMFPVEPTEGTEADWVCEIDCDTDEVNLQNWGSVEMVARDMRVKACITSTFARDAALDVEGRIANIAREGFERKISREYFSVNPQGGMQGALTPGNHVVVETSNALDFKESDLRRLAAVYPSIHAQGARWIMNCNTAAYVATLDDAFGRPLIDFASGSAAGFPILKVDQMPQAFDNTGALVGGSIPVALVNFNNHYVLGRREDFRASRNPYRKENCGLIEWYFYMALAGVVKCNNAFYALRVKESA